MATAVSSAFADCSGNPKTNCPCTSQADAAAQAVATAVATAISAVLVETSGEYH